MEDIKNMVETFDVKEKLNKMMAKTDVDEILQRMM